MDISAEHAELTTKLPLYRFIDDVIAGEEVIKSAKVRYLPYTAGMRSLKEQISKQQVTADIDDVTYLYNDLVDRAQFPSWVEEAVLVMTGLIAKVIPNMEIPARLEYLAENCTNDGFSLTELFQRVCYHLMRYGKVTLVGDIDEDGVGYISLYDAYSEYNWAPVKIRGRNDLGMVAFKETIRVDQLDYFNTETQEVRRAYIINPSGQAEVWVSKDKATAVKETEHLGMPTRPLDYLPVVRLSAINNIGESSNPPLLPLCRCALKAYVLSADLFSALHRSCHPQLYVTGISASPIASTNPNGGKKLQNLNYTGAGTVWTLPSGSTAGYVEPQGNGMAKVSEEIGKQKSSALEAGAKVMDIGVESGDAREARQNDQYASLYSIVQNSAKAIEQIIRYIFDMTSATEDKAGETAIRFEVPTDFGRHIVDGTLAAHLLTAAERGATSFNTYWTYLTSGKLPERTLTEEVLQAKKETIELKPVTGMVQATKQGKES